MKEEDTKRFVKLISKDGLEFIVEEDAAKVSPYLKAALESKFKESKTREIRLEEISGKVLERVVQYFCHRYKYDNRTAGSTTPGFHLEPEEALDVLAAANYLDC